MDIRGFNVGTWIPENRRIRVTLTERNWFTPDNFFASSVQSFYDKTYSTTKTIPVSPHNGIPGSPSATYDVNNKAARNGADIVKAFSVLVDNFAEVATLELLDEHAPSATSDTSQEARDAARDSENAKKKVTDPIRKLGDALGVGADTLKYVAIAVLVIVVLVMVRRAK